MGLLVELLDSSKLHKFLNDSIKYRQILSVHFTSVSNNTSELNYDFRRSSDYKYLICANKIHRFYISRYCNRIGFSKTKITINTCVSQKVPRKYPGPKHSKLV
jgi:hypothetical protein